MKRYLFFGIQIVGIFLLVFSLFEFFEEDYAVAWLYGFAAIGVFNLISILNAWRKK